MFFDKKKRLIDLENLLTEIKINKEKSNNKKIEECLCCDGKGYTYDRIGKILLFLVSLGATRRHPELFKQPCKNCLGLGYYIV
jgi:hypothetical protein